MSNPNYDPSKLASIRTYMMIAFIFNIIGMIAFVLGGIWELFAYATFSSVFYGFGYFAGGLLVEGIILLVFFGLSLFVFFRVRRMYTAANHSDVATLKSLNNMMWAIIALIFAGVIPGIMLLISFGPINELGQSQTPPPPPPM